MIAQNSSLRVYSAGQAILTQGQPLDGWYILRSGDVRVFMSGEDGREQTVRFAHAGDLLGGGGTAGHGYSAVAIADGVEVCRFDPAAQARLFATCPALAGAFLSLMVQQLAQSYRRIHHLLSTTASGRLVDALIRMSDGQLPTPIPVHVTRRDASASFGLSRQQLADMLGVTRETAVRALSMLKRNGLIQTRGQTIVVTDVEALKRQRRSEGIELEGSRAAKQIAGGQTVSPLP